MKIYSWVFLPVFILHQNLSGRDIRLENDEDEAQALRTTDPEGLTFSDDYRREL
jgi:hypothetical protein